MLIKNNKKSKKEIRRWTEEKQKKKWSVTYFLVSVSFGLLLLALY